MIWIEYNTFKPPLQNICMFLIDKCFIINIYQPAFSKNLVCSNCRATFCAKIICARAYVRFCRKNKLGNFWELQAHARMSSTNVAKKLWGVRHKKIALTVSARTLQHLKKNRSNCSIRCRDSRRMSYEPIKKWVCPYIYPPQILMVCM